MEVNFPRQILPEPTLCPIPCPAVFIWWAYVFMRLRIVMIGVYYLCSLKEIPRPTSHLSVLPVCVRHLPPSVHRKHISNIWNGHGVIHTLRSIRHQQGKSNVTVTVPVCSYVLKVSNSQVCLGHGRCVDERPCHLVVHEPPCVFAEGRVLGLPCHFAAPAFYASWPRNRTNTLI